MTHSSIECSLNKKNQQVWKNANLQSTKFTKSKNAVVIERELCKIVKNENWSILAHLLIDHGRKVCVANRPKCQDCILNDLCPSSK